MRPNALRSARTVKETGRKPSSLPNRCLQIGISPETNPKSLLATCVPLFAPARSSSLLEHWGMLSSTLGSTSFVEISFAFHFVGIEVSDCAPLSTSSSLASLGIATFAVRLSFSALAEVCGVRAAGRFRGPIAVLCGGRIAVSSNESLNSAIVLGGALGVPFAAALSIPTLPFVLAFVVNGACSPSLELELKLT